MLKTRKILLASHGTDGARAAERIALKLCGSGATLRHLVVVPDFWKGMMGDDWLNNASTQAAFGRYIEKRLEDDVRQHIAKVRRQAQKRRIRYVPQVVFGKPSDCLLAEAGRGKVDLVVLGSRRPRGKPGLRSRMLTDELFKRLRTPVLVAPYPNA